MGPIFPGDSISGTRLVVVALLIILGDCCSVIEANSGEPPIGRFDTLAARPHSLVAKRSIDSRPPKLTAATLFFTVENTTFNQTLAESRNDANFSSFNSYNATVAGFLLADRADLRLNSSDSIDRTLASILSRDGPDMRPSRDYKDFKDISLGVSTRAWTLLHERTQRVMTNHIELAMPTIREALFEAKTSKKCRNAIELTMEAAKRLESWAIKLMNSWGTFPMSGIFEGTYGDPGSFHTCLSITEVDKIDHAHYCSIAFRPVMPSRPRFELVVRKEPDALLNLFNDGQGDELGSQNKILESLMGKQIDDKRKAGELSALNKSTTMKTGINQPSKSRPRDAFSDILEHAQYHHYVYYKLGTCWPIQCSPFDIKRLVKLLAKRNMLLHGPVKCYSENSDDYEEPDEIDDDDDNNNNNNNNQNNNLAASQKNLETQSSSFSYQEHEQEFGLPIALPSTVSTNTSMKKYTNQTTATTRRPKKKLVISIWDKNKGIFIWKPFFNQTQKIALAVIIVASLFILIMTLIDLFWLRMPILIYKFKLAINGLPLTTTNSSDSSEDDDIGSSFQQTTAHSVNFALCATRKQQASSGAKVLSSTTPVDCTASATTASILTEDHHEMAHRLQVRSRCSRPTPASGSFFLSLVDDCSILTNAPQFFHVSEGQMKNDILCLNGIRCITMIWIIMTHTMMYNDWSGFARTRAVEVALKSLFSQPFFNGSYLVDTFFLMSGLLSAFTAFKHCEGMRTKFNSFAYIFGRWLRLTPQIFFISMIYIIFPSLSSGPHWFPIVGEYSENCVSNWWINVLHLQAFYKKDEMCNFVTWWISIDFFYHFFALFVIWVIILTSHLFGFISMTGIILGGIAWQCWQHYDLALPPNILSTIPQTGSMWTTMTLDFFWTPYTHVVPFFFGFYIGYLMSLKRKLILKNLNTRRALIGWSLSVSLLWFQGYSTFWWVTGEADYSPLISTIFYTICPIIWAGSLCWIIIASHHGYGGFINRILSWKVFIVLGKASYLVYLSHFQILFIFFGQQNLLLEPTTLNMVYIIFGNIFFSTLYGIFLCIIYELPWLKMHRRLMKYI